MREWFELRRFVVMLGLIWAGFLLCCVLPVQVVLKWLGLIE